MDALKLLHKKILKSEVIKHRYRLTALMKAVVVKLGAQIRGKKGSNLDLTYIGSILYK